MPDIFDQLSAKNNPPAPATPAPAPEASVGGDIFDKIHAGEDVAPKLPQSAPGFIDPGDTGVLNSLKRNIGGILRLPGHVINAFSNGPQDDTEHALAGATAGEPGASQVLLGLKRLVVDPMIEQHRQAKAYSAMWDKMTPEEQKKAQESMFNASANHLSNMHHIASVVPLLGPAAGDMVDRMGNGDVSGGLTDLIFNLATAGAMKKLSARAGKLAPTEKVIAGEKVPVLASQAGNTDAAALETAAKASGSAKPINQFVINQSKAITKGLGNVANDSASDAVAKLSRAGSPRYAYRLRDVGEDGIPVKNGHAQASMGEDEVRGYGPHRSTGPQELARVNLDKLEPSTYELKPGPNGHSWVKFNEPVHESLVDSIPLDKNFAPATRYALAKSSNFGEAADAMRAAARPKLQLVDDATKGRIGEIMDERDALLAQSKGASFGKYQAIQKQLGELSTEEDGLFQLRNPQTGAFQKVITAPQRAQFTQAVKVWKQANAMEQVHAAIDGASDGAGIAQRLGKLDDSVIQQAVGGDTAHMQAIKDATKLLSSGAKAAEVNKVLRLVKMVTQKGSLGSSNIASRGISLVLTNRAAATALAAGVKAGASAPVIAASIDKVLEREQKTQ